MKQSTTQHIRDLLERIVRINAAEEWSDELSPTQLTALSYLVQANRFSRSPSQVAEFLTTTRGTVSQTLKVLARKGLIEKVPSQIDRRWATYEVTNTGLDAVNRSTVIDEVLDGLNAQTANALTADLELIVRDALKARGQRRFGVCKTCRHYKARKVGGFCTLLHEELTKKDADQICHEYQDAA